MDSNVHVDVRACAMACSGFHFIIEVRSYHSDDNMKYMHTFYEFNTL